MLTKGDDYPIHQTPDPIAFSGANRNFYDRYFFNGHTIDSEVFFAAAHGVYPQLGIMDAAFAVRVGGRQYNLHASRHLGFERMDTRVGPVAIDVIEPLQRLRVRVDDNEHGIRADLVFEGRHFPIEEPRTVRRNGPRLVQDITRLTQLGHWTGWIEAGGQRVDLSPATTRGTRDRSWGIRQVGAPDSQPPVTPQEFQVWWYWVPAHFDSCAMHFFINEDHAGKPWNYGFHLVHDDGRSERLLGGKLDVSFHPGSRYPASARLTARDEAGGAYAIDIALGRRFYLSGIGYMNPEWSHGLNKGPLALGYDEIDIDAITRHAAPYQHPQAFAQLTMTLPSGEVQHGTGCFESIVLGRHAPSGLVSMMDVP